MDSYGHLYINEKQSTHDSIISLIEKDFSIGNQDSLAFDVAYKQAISIFRKLEKREPTKGEKEALLGPAKERFRVISKRITAKQKGALIEYSHPVFSVENIPEIAKRVSSQDAKMHVCAVAGFDHSVFLLHIYAQGQAETLHQIGDELEDMGLSSIIGDVQIISCFFGAREDIVRTFLESHDVMEAEELFSKSILPSSGTVC